MPGLTLLNIDRQTTSTGDPMDEIREIIDEITEFTTTVDADAQEARLVPLKMKLRRLQDAVSQFGADGSINVEVKQNNIMELHPELQMLANQLVRYGQQFATQTEICMNFLLNHLCSTAASDPKSTVIGVGNVMAQVLSSEIKIIPTPDFELTHKDPKYFEKFARHFNSMLTTAGLFAAPILGLPDIPISALGKWADQALQQFNNVNEFIKENYDPRVFYKIDQSERAIPFDTTTDILSYFVYENEFLAALIARADILSGLEFPGGFTDDDNPMILQSTDDITNLLVSAIEQNCGDIRRIINTTQELFQTGVIDRNERPEDHQHLMTFEVEAKIWTNIAQLGRLMIKIFSKSREITNIPNEFNFFTLNASEVPLIDEDAPQIVEQLHSILKGLYDSIFEMFPEALSETQKFVKSSEFTKFRLYLRYITYIVGAHDILLVNEKPWTPWLMNRLRPFILDDGINYNPHGSLEVGTTSILLGVIADNDEYIKKGRSILNKVKPHLEFQQHHLLAINILTELSEIYNLSSEKVANSISETINEFLENNEVSQQSMLFQRANLYLGMLDMLKKQGEFLRKENERHVAFDPFSWLQIPKNLNIDWPYMPLNTKIDNLNSG